MNRGFQSYFREGLQSSVKTLFKNKNYFRYFIYFFMEFLAWITLVFSPFFALANVRLAETVRKEKRFNLSQSFKNAGKGKPFWGYVSTVIVEMFVVLAGIAACAVVGFALGALGYAVGSFIAGADKKLFALLFAIPAALLALVYAFFMVLIFAPTPYIIAANENIGIGDTLSVCFNTMKNDGKATLFLNSFVNGIIKLGMLGIVAGGAYGLSLLGGGIGALLCALWLIVGLAGFAVAAPIFTLTQRIADNHLFEDIVLDPVATSKYNSGIRITRCMGKKVDAATASMREMFESTFTEDFTSFDELERKGKKKKEKKERPAAEDVFPGEPDEAPEKKLAEKAEPVAAEVPAEEPAAEPPAEQEPFEAFSFDEMKQAALRKETAEPPAEEPAEEVADETPAEEPETVAPPAEESKEETLEEEVKPFAFEEPKKEEEKPAANPFSFDEPKKEEKPAANPFSFDEPKKEEKPAANPFSFDEPKKEEKPAANPFSFDEPKKEAKPAANPFSFDEPKKEAKPAANPFSFDEPKKEAKPAANPFDFGEPEKKDAFDMSAEPKNKSFGFDEEIKPFSFDDAPKGKTGGNDGIGAFNFGNGAAAGGFDPDAAEKEAEPSKKSDEEV